MHKHHEIFIAAIAEVKMADYALSLKISQLFAIAMMDYRGSAGDEAWLVMRELAGAEQVSALAFLTGFCSAAPMTEETLLRICPAVQNRIDESHRLSAAPN